MGGALWPPLPIQVRWGAWGGGGFVATITHTGEVGSVCGGGGLCGYHYPYK